MKGGCSACRRGGDLGNIGTDTRASSRKSGGGAHDERHSSIICSTHWLHVRGHLTANQRDDYDVNEIHYRRLQSPSCCCKFHSSYCRSDLLIDQAHYRRTSMSLTYRSCLGKRKRPSQAIVVYHDRDTNRTTY